MDRTGPARSEDDLEVWARTGLLALTGEADGPPLSPPRGLRAGLDGLVEHLADSAGQLGAALEVDWSELVLGRAALLGLARRGQTSANGSCRLLRAADGWWALNLARPDDVALVPALLEREIGPSPWAVLAVESAARPGAELVERARLLSLPAALVERPDPAQAIGRMSLSEPRARTDVRGLRVVDLSALWAGPLCAALLRRAGMDVLKVEGDARLDGARAEPAFYRWLHGDAQPCLTLDLASSSGRGELRELLEAADVVIESSRPRALAQLGLAPSSLDLRHGVVWLSITGHGRAEPAPVGFGDDAAAAGGLVAFDELGAPVFCGDAIADPLAGLSAAAAVLDALGTGGGMLLDVAMSRVAGALLDATSWGAPIPLVCEERDERWFVESGSDELEVLDPRPPRRPIA